MHENQQIKTENAEMRKRVKKLERKMIETDAAINDLEQYGRREMIEIDGFPATKDSEDVEKLVIRVAAACEGHQQMQRPNIMVRDFEILTRINFYKIFKRWKTSMMLKIQTTTMRNSRTIS